MQKLKFALSLITLFLFSSVITTKIFAEYSSLQEAVSATTPAEREYSLSADENVTNNLGNLGGEQLTIFGNGYDINGNYKLGIILSKDQILNLSNINSFNNFKSTSKGSVICNNNGTINLDVGTIFLDNLVSATNYGQTYGGAIYNIGTINISSSTFLNNAAIYGTTSYGGAIYSSGTIMVSSSVFNNNSARTSISDSNAKAAYGGAFYANSGLVNISSSSFINNIAKSTYSYGGAIYNNKGEMLVTNTEFVDNNLYGRFSYGGAVYNNNTISVSSCIFEGNEIISETFNFSNNCYSYGGAIYSSGTITILDSIFKDNYIYGPDLRCSKSCSYGGAIYNIGTINISSSTFENNILIRRDDYYTHFTYGGAIYNSGTANITDSIFLENQTITSGDNSSNGVAIYNRNIMTISNSIFLKNKLC